MHDLSELKYPIHRTLLLLFCLYSSSCQRISSDACVCVCEYVSAFVVFFLFWPCQFQIVVDFIVYLILDVVHASVLPLKVHRMHMVLYTFSTYATHLATWPLCVDIYFHVFAVKSISCLLLNQRLAVFLAYCFFPHAPLICAHFCCRYAC